MKVINVGKGLINLEHLSKQKTVKEAVPIELYFKENGTLDEKPSLAIVMSIPFDKFVVGEMSLETLKECLDELGYEIKEKK